MMACAKTVSFQGIEALPREVHVRISTGLSAFRVVGLSDKAAKESWGRICAAFHSIGLSIPRECVNINLTPLDTQNEGDHYDLPIALGILGAWGVIPLDELSEYCVLGKLDLKGNLNFVSGVLPAAIMAYSQRLGLICPESTGAEAVWAGENFKILAPKSLISLINHFKGTQVLTRPQEKFLIETPPFLDLKNIQGHETLKRMLEIAAAGGHNLWIRGLSLIERSKVAACLPGILPPLQPWEALEVSMIHSVAGLLKEGGLISKRPFRHLSDSASSMSREGKKALPNLEEIFLAHRGVLFLDEISEFSESFCEALRHSLGAGEVKISEITYPAQIQLICASEDLPKIVEPLVGYMDLSLEVSNNSSQNFSNLKGEESSESVRKRVVQAREAQKYRYEKLLSSHHIKMNSELKGDLLEEVAVLDGEAQDLLNKTSEKFKFCSHKILRVARTIADLEASITIQKHHIAEALNYRPLIFQ